MPRILSHGPFRYVARNLASVRWITVSTIVRRSLSSSPADLVGRESRLGGARIMVQRRAAYQLECLLEVVAQEPSARLLDCHGLSDFASDTLEPAFGVESQRGALDVGGADDHAREAELAGHLLGRA